MQKLMSYCVITKSLLKLVFFSIILCCMVFILPSTLNVNSQSVEMDLIHSVQITNSGLIVVNETVRNVKSIDFFYIGFHKSFVKHLDNTTVFTSLGEKGKVLTSEIEEGTNIYWLNLSFEEVNTDNLEYFSVIFVFSKLITYNDTEPTVYNASFPKYPALRVDALSCMVEILLPYQTSLIDSSWGNSTIFLKSPLEKKSNQTGFVSFLGTLNYIECNYAEREVFIDSWGNIISQDTYNIRNVGKEIVTGLAFPLPNNVDNVVAYDDLGSLTSSETELNGNTKVYVTFRYPLRGEENSVQYHDSYSFTIKYTFINTQGSLMQSKLFSYFQFKTDFFPKPDWTIKSLLIKIKFPEGTKNIQASPTPTNIIQNFLTQVIMYSIKNYTQFNESWITINYEYNILWSAFYPTLWSSMIVAILGGIIFLREMRKARLPQLLSKDIELIHKYIDRCRELLTVWLEIETLENDLDNKRIRRKYFNRRRRIYIQQISSLNKEIEKLEKRVSQTSVKHSELIKKMNKAKVEIQTLHSEIDRLRNQLRKGKLSKNAFMKLSEAYGKRIQKAKKAMETVINELIRM